MKKPFCLIFAALVALTIGTTAALFADEEAEKAEVRRKAYVEGFEQLLKNTAEGLAKPAIKDSSSEYGKFAIAPVTVTTTTNNLGIKVWFSLEDGTIFNPVKRKMGVKEKFYVHIQSAVPVYVSLFQNYPESRPESRQVYPDTKYPESFKVIQAGIATKLPTAFEMDDNTLDEIMAMVVVRADAPQIQSTLNTQATTTVTNTGGVTVVTAQATPATAGTMKSINDGLAGKTMEDPTKFAIATPSATAPVTTTVTTTTVTTAPPTAAPNDVSFFMLGTGYAGQWQLTLKK
jgi:hypothetical protein